MEIRAYAKINLSLDIVGRRNDGYHLLRTVMQSISLCDSISLVASGSGKATVSCDDSCISNGRNTILRAARVFQEETGFSGNDGIRFSLQKRIPMQAGLGGGSTDAAAALKLLNSFYNAGLSLKHLCRIGLKVGADVPFCLVGGTALAEGIGENLRRVPALPSCRIVVCRPEAGVSTVSAYEAFDRCKTVFKAGTDRMLEALHSGDLHEIGNSLSNAFSCAEISPETEKIREIMLAFHSEGACMTGSGSAVYGLFDGVEKAEKCRRYLAGKYPSVFCCDPVSNIASGV